MGSISNGFALILILILSVSSLSIFVSIPFGVAQSGTNVSGIISQDSTWTTSGSPYVLTGNTLVYQGVTLTIQSGVTVNFGSYYIEVNGTLSAIGNPTDKITFNGGQITFTSSSNGWNEQTDSGCLIENANINQTSINSSNPLKIDNSNINGNVFVTSSIISNNIITSAVTGSNSIISNNIVKGDITTQVSSVTGSTQSESSVISNNTVTGNINIGYFNGITASGDTSTVSNNIINGSISIISTEGTPEIYKNTVSDGGIGCAGYGSISNNFISGCKDGISLYTVRGFGGDLACQATVENNLVTDNTHGIDIELTSVFGPSTLCPTIQSNTISGNQVGIYLSESYYDSTPTFQNNNLQNNSNYNFYLTAPNNINATYNWWGTTTPQAINQTIYDYKNDFTLGKVSFVPFLNAPNSQAPSPTILPTPSPTSTPTNATTTPILATTSPTSTPTSPTSTSVSSASYASLLLITTIAIVVIAFLLAVIVFLLLYRRHRKPQVNDIKS